MLPSLRLIVAAFLGGFVVASAGLHLAASRPGPFASGPPALPRGEILPAVAGTIDWRHADTPLPPLFDLRFSADLTAIAAIPAPLTLPAPPREGDPQ